MLRVDDGESSRMSAFASRSTAAARVSRGELSSRSAFTSVFVVTIRRDEWTDGVEYDVDAAAPRTARRTAAIRAPSSSLPSSRTPRARASRFKTDVSRLVLPSMTSSPPRCAHSPSRLGPNVAGRGRASSACALQI